jgi:hypothetical protein
MTDVVSGSEVAASQNPQPKPTEIKIILPTNAYFMSGIRDFTLSLMSFVVMRLSMARVVMIRLKFVL